MAATTINNADSMEVFVNEIHRFIDDIQNSLNTLNGAYATLGEDWQDNKRLEFDEQIQHIAHSINSFAEFGEDCINHLSNQIRILREYEGS